VDAVASSSSSSAADDREDATEATTPASEIRCYSNQPIECFLRPKFFTIIFSQYIFLIVLLKFKKLYWIESPVLLNFFSILFHSSIFKSVPYFTITAIRLLTAKFPIILKRHLKAIFFLLK